MADFSGGLPALNDLSLEDKIGQMLCLGWDGADSYLAVNDQARECVADLRAGGMIVFGRNVQLTAMSGESPAHLDVSGVRAVLDELQSLATIPLLIATDQEGGRVARFSTPPFTRMPSARIVGARGDVGLARQAAWATGRELAALGVNMNFAPDADVDSNPANPVIGDRSFSRDAHTVAEFVAAQVEGYAEGGVLACAKHFPGHGDTAQDSHFALPTLPFDWAEVEARELVPFRAAIAAGVGAIMTAHISMPALDPSGDPATLSRPILTGLLRERLGFNGLIMTDSLGMRAVADGWGTPGAAVRAAQAGADVLLVCHTLQSQRDTQAALLAAARLGELPMAQIDASVGRILDAKRRLLAQPQPDLNVVGAPEHEAIRRNLANEAPASSAFSTLGEDAT